MKKRSPLKDKPLRTPGQSLDEKLDDVLYDNALAPMMLAGVLIILACLEWVKSIYSLPPAPKLYTVLAAGGLLYTGVRIYLIWPRLQALKQGRNGERAVGQFLERLRTRDYIVFHDVVGKDFNIDHVLIGPAGVFTIETKTYSKKSGPDEKVRFDGVVLTVDELKLDRDPVVQGKSQANWLRHLLEESTGRKLLTKPVVLFPGWFVEQSPGSTRDIWVLEPKALPAFLENEPACLSPEDVKLASFHLSRYIRTQVP